MQSLTCVWLKDNHRGIAKNHDALQIGWLSAVRLISRSFVIHFAFSTAQVTFVPSPHGPQSRLPNRWHFICKRANPKDRVDIIPDQSRTGQAPGRAAIVASRYVAEAVVRAQEVVVVVPTAATVTRLDKVRAVQTHEREASRRLTTAQTRRRGKGTTTLHARGQRQRPLLQRSRPCATT